MFLPMMDYARTPVQYAAKPLLKLNERPIQLFRLFPPGTSTRLKFPCDVAQISIITIRRTHSASAWPQTVYVPFVQNAKPFTTLTLRTQGNPAAFALVALIFVLMGIFGIIACTVAQRTQEIAIRRAMGAQEREVPRDVMGPISALAVVGVFIGGAAAFALRTDPADALRV